MNFIKKISILFILAFMSAAVPVNAVYAAGSGGTVSCENDKRKTDKQKQACACSESKMKSMYMADGKVDKYCWYCKIVVVMTNAYLRVASQALPSSTALARIILLWGFSIWLAYHVLQNVSSIKAVGIGKMLQEILVMGFKVALASACVEYAQNVIVHFFIDPIMGLGLDYGSSLLDGLNKYIST